MKSVSNAALPPFNPINPPTAWKRNLAESALIIKQPDLIVEHGSRYIDLVPDDYPPWDKDTTHNPTCAEQLTAVLSGLSACTAISGITLHLSDILTVPIDHNHPSSSSSPSNTPIIRTPNTILSTLSIPALCTSLGRWTLPSHPRISVTDPQTLTLLHHLHTSSDIPTFLAQVAASGAPLLQAGEYTADFYSRDLRHARPPPESDPSVRISLGPYGAGTVARAEADELSVVIAGDLAANTAFYESGKGVWQAGLYDVYRKERGQVGSRLETAAGEQRMGAATSVVIKGMPEGMTGAQLEAFRARVGEMMGVGEDEEVVFVGSVGTVRKKVGWVGGEGERGV